MTKPIGRPVSFGASNGSTDPDYFVAYYCQGWQHCFRQGQYSELLSFEDCGYYQFSLDLPKLG